ncbi:MAG: DUF5915 domain-containing protein, partial [Thermodesulfobacteriota bacterium]|nr:DUF5915 domain-containing protein [Thermodesulfobacteriota bacterium]
EVIVSESDRLIGEIKGGAQDVTVSVDGTQFVLETSDLIIETHSPDEYAVSEDGDTWVSFETTITEDLKIEGLMRDLLRRFQVMRKDEGLEIEDRITLQWDTSSKVIEQVFEHFSSLLAEELLVVEMTRQHAMSEGKVIKTDEFSIKVAIKKSNTLD